MIRWAAINTMTSRIARGDPANPPYPGWAGWLSGLAALRRYHELPQWRTIWRQIEIAGVPEGMFSIDQ